MSRKYEASDFTGAKPRVIAHRSVFGDRVYTWFCSDETSGSRGYGTTPKDAYNAWARNYRRREAFYRNREARDRMVLASFEQRMRRVK